MYDSHLALFVQVFDWLHTWIQAVSIVHGNHRILGYAHIGAAIHVAWIIIRDHAVQVVISARKLSNNQFTGSIPPEIGSLANLQQLSLGRNQLTGSIPPELGNLTNLSSLVLSDNPLSGSLPLSLTNLTSLRFFVFENTDLCEPSDSTFQAWLQGIDTVRSTGVTCTATTP